MQKEKKLNLLGQLMLLMATVIWGTSFFILKETISKVPEFYVLAIRFTVSGILLALVFIKRIIKIPKKTILRGVILGVILVLAYSVQTFGLANTTPSRNAFLTSAYCVIAPFLFWLICKTAPKFYNVLSAVLCIIGIGFVAFSGKNETASNLLLGDGLTLIGAVFYALQIIFIDKYQAEEHDPISLLTVELLTVGVICLVASLITELPRGVENYSLTLDQILKIGYLTLVCTAGAQGLQMFGQRYATANQSSLILSLEAVFGTLFSVLLGDEKLTLGLGVGFSIIFIAMMITEFKLDPVKLLSKKTNFVDK